MEIHLGTPSEIKSGMAGEITPDLRATSPGSSQTMVLIDTNVLPRRLDAYGKTATSAARLARTSSSSRGWQAAHRRAARA